MTMSFRTPLKQVRGLGSAKSGTQHWWGQRVTAMAALPLVIASLGIVVSLVGADYATVKERLSYAPVTIILALTTLVLLKHMRLGMQVILEDYVHGEKSRIACLLLNTFFTYGVGAVAAFALFKLAFGS